MNEITTTTIMISLLILYGISIISVIVSIITTKIIAIGLLIAMY